MGGAGRVVCGMILRGAGAEGVAGCAGAEAAGAAVTPAVGAAAAFTVFAGAAGLAAGSALASCLLASTAFNTSPGLDTCDRSIFGVMACAPRADAPPEAGRAP